MSHERIEKNIGLMAVLVIIVISFGGLVQIVPLMFQSATVEPAEGVEPYSAIRLAGRDVYISEGCYNCHSQMIRPFRSETERYGHYSVAGEFVYDRPFQWGSKRTGPDLARVGAKYSDDWHRLHLMDPRAVVPASNMPAYPWLAEKMVSPEQIQQHMRALKRLGDPYSDADIEAAFNELVGVTQLDALIAYLQGLGQDWTGQEQSSYMAGSAGGTQ
ncbi:MAG: cytochrome-c oxidase, cbb3-type subunit II [Wenzhouxiangellaceae bacterium]|nr:cytochrome-c oxidase, cbb3-type subunit II [Wenzhouxiangellaceae bacterium]